MRLARLTLFSILFFILMISISFAANTHGLRSQQREMQAWFGDREHAHINSGCLPTLPTSSLTIDAFPCQGYVKDGVEAIFADQPSFAITVVHAADPTWLGLRRSRSLCPAGWTCVTGTHYMFLSAANRPADGDGFLVHTKVTTSPGAITAVEPFAFRSPQDAALKRHDPVNWGASGDGSTDDTVAITAACNAVQTVGTGAIDFKDRTYSIYNDQTGPWPFLNSAPTTVLCDFDSVNGLKLLGTGAHFFLNNVTMSTSGDRLAIFKFEDSANIEIGDFRTTFTGSRCDILQCGYVFAYFEDVNENIRGGNLETSDASVPYWFQNTIQLTGTESATENIVIDNVKATNVGYGIVMRGSGHRITYRLDCDGCGRSGQIQDVLGPSTFHITSRNNTATQDVGISGEAHNIDLTYINTRSTNVNVSRAVGIHIPDVSEPGHRTSNIHIKIHVISTGAAYLRRCITVGLSVGANPASADATWFAENIHIEGVCIADVNLQQGVVIDFPSSWTEAQNLSNITVGPFIMSGGGANNYDLRGLTDRALIQNVISSSGLQLRGPTAIGGGTIVVNNTIASDFFNNTSDAETFPIRFANSTDTAGGRFTLPMDNRYTINTSTLNSGTGIDDFVTALGGQTIFQERALFNSATPSVANGNMFRTGGATGITNFTFGRVGQCIKIRADHTLTIFHGATIRLAGGLNLGMVSPNTLSLCMFSAGVWDEVGRKQ